MADIFHGKCNLQCPALRLKSNRLSLLIYLTEANRKDRGRSWPGFWASSPMEQSSSEVILAMLLHQTMQCPPPQHTQAAVSHLAKAHGPEKGCPSHLTSSCCSSCFLCEVCPSTHHHALLLVTCAGHPTRHRRTHHF